MSAIPLTSLPSRSVHKAGLSSGWNDQTVLSIHEKQWQARAEARRLNLEGHAAVPVELPETLLYGAAIRAKIDGVFVADWISSAVEERIRNDELSDRIFRRRKAQAQKPSTRCLTSCAIFLATTHPIPATNSNPNHPSQPGAAPEFQA